MRLIFAVTALGIAAVTAQQDPYRKSGNVPPRIERLGPAQEAEILKDVKLADGFQASLFATPSAANYPVYVAAAPNGDLYVSSDGNGSLGRDPGRGRVVKLRDTDRDGRADEVTEFVKNVDSPRGLVWDHDRLYLIHPPDISCYIDRDGDGVADEKKTLVKDIAFGFKDRPADHTTNGLTLGIDGWLYISVGDFGFKEAVGADGKRLQLRGGGVVRIRPDGSGMEIFSEGTRNILGTPVSPTLDLFARDNTNDGGGWDIRFHHFTGLEDHGYPRLYMNFNDEVVQPVADYGGGSGCGSAYLSEPGIPVEWNDAPLTCDWGTNGLWHHSLQLAGTTFRESSPPRRLIEMTRPTDADVDGMSAIYQASWLGANFKWAGPDVGYIVRVTPKGYTPEPLPDFDKAADMGLVEALESPSQVRTLEAQRTLLRRPANAGTNEALAMLAGDPGKPLPARVAALFTLAQRDAGAISPLASDPKLQRFVLRALGDGGPDATDVFAAGLKSPDARTRLEAVVGATRRNVVSLAPQIATQLGDADPVLAHTAFQALSRLRAADACFAVLDNPSSPPAQRTGALRALMRIHDPEVVRGLTQRLATTGPESRAGILAALCRLYFREGEWKGDSWGTRPDTRGPYYQPEKWSESANVAAVLKAELASATPAAAPGLIRELSRNRIEFDEALDRLIAVVKDKPELLPDLVAQLASAEIPRADGVPYLIAAATGDWPAATAAQAVVALVRTDSREGWLAALAAVEKLSRSKDHEKPFERAKAAFLSAPKLENQHQLWEAAAVESTATAMWADAALLSLSERKTGSPESREMSAAAIRHGWENPARRVRILQAIGAIDFHGMDDQVLKAVADPDPAVAAAAAKTAEILKLETKGADKTPLVGSLDPQEAVAQVLKMKGKAAIGKQVFVRQSCATCHAVSPDEAQKGPYLGNIAQTYGRKDLALNILDPGRTIAQGFATESITLKDGTAHVVFITLESSDQVKARNIAGQEFTWKTSEITKRDKLPISMMPPGLANGMTVREFASVLDYLESLSKKEE